MIGFYIRYGLRDFESLDYLGFYATWYDEIKENGGLKGLGIQVSDCNYNMLYQFLIAVLTHIPINSLHAYKILSCIFDFSGAVVVALTVKHFAKERAMAKIFMAYAVAFLSPLVFLNSAAWAQCDAIYTFFIIACLLALLKDKPAMHERYGYIYEILAIVIAVVNKKTIPLLAALFYMSGCTYGHYLYETEVNMPVLSLINTATFLLYCYICGREMKGNGGKVTLCGQNTVGNREE